jgi:CheY-like chemotaxis protein
VVRDTGPGLAAEEVARLFAPFERGQAGGTGTGLGLSIARRLAGHLGGNIEVESVPGAGSRFAAVLPLGPDPEATAVPLSASLSGARILVVSAAPFSGPWLAEALEAAGAVCRLVADLGAPRAALDEGRWTCILLDRSLGEGTAALAEAARGYGIRTVALLEPRERRDFERLQARGFDRFLVKPIRNRSLLSVVGASVEPQPVRLDPAKALTSGETRRALLAEDDPVNALLARAQLTRLGYSVEHVADGEAAIAAFGRALDAGKGFELALLDLRLPGLDGCAVARRLRALEKGQGSRAILVALTANTGEEERQAVAQAGMDAFLGKPLDREALARLLPAAPLAPIG